MMQWYSGNILDTLLGHLRFFGSQVRIPKLTLKIGYYVHHVITAEPTVMLTTNYNQPITAYVIEQTLKQLLYPLLTKPITKRPVA